VDPRADDDTRLAHRTQRERNERPDRREDDRRVELFRRFLGRAARPLRAERAREVLTLEVAVAREREYTLPSMARDLRDDVRGGAEPVQPEPFRVARERERPVPDQPGAQKRRAFNGGEAIRQREAEALVRDHVLGVPTVAVIAGELRVVAEVFEPRAAVAAVAVGPPEPGNPNPAVLADHVSDDLVADDDRKLPAGELVVDDVEVGPADGARRDAHEQLAATRDGLGKLGRPQRPPRLVEDHRAHRCSLPGRATPTLSRVTTTDYEAVPAVERDAEAAHLQTVVMKFGGTSVADAEKLKNVARRLVAAREAGTRVVAVLSAMGHTTDELLDLARQISDTPDPRELDMLVSVGERISCALCAMAIHDLGHEAISLTGSQAGIVTDTVHGKAKIVDVRARRIHEALDRNEIVLVAGFQGVSSEQEVTTLGRGGSDTTAVALAAALGASACEIYTDVQGVYTADPRLVPDARKLDVLTHEEMLEMASSGARVMATRSIEVARSHNVQLHVRSTFSDGPGTWIREEKEMLEKALISGVVHQREETVYRVDGVSPATLFAALADASVNVDTIVQTGPEIVFSAPVEDRADAARALDSLGVRWSARDDLGKVSLVGAGMKSHPGVAAKTFATLEAAGIDAPVVSTSPIKIACHVATSDVDRAVQALHEAFELG
jgi:aspartate kinase